MAIKETRHMSMTELRALCVKRDWFTMGSIDQYDRFLQLTNGEITTDRLRQMAEAILWFSEEDTIEDMGVTNIMFELGRICFTTFEEE